MNLSSGIKRVACGLVILGCTIITSGGTIVAPGGATARAAPSGTTLWNPPPPQIGGGLAGPVGTLYTFTVRGLAFTPGGTLDLAVYYYTMDLYHYETTRVATLSVTAAPYYQICIIGSICGAQVPPGSFNVTFPVQAGPPLDPSFDRFVVTAYDESTGSTAQAEFCPVYAIDCPTQAIEHY